MQKQLNSVEFIFDCINDYYSTNSFFFKYQHVYLNADIGIWFQTE